ncbi:MAG TPA: hypothetical protein VFL85_05335 [Candidatus Saccharimonadales bacterium]|nr:hypothetical protein [Candidatus Saccharimonadales bacterium]
MSEAERTPPEHLQDLGLQDTGLSAEDDVYGCLLGTEHAEVARNFEDLCVQFQRLDMLPTASVYHSFGTTDGSVAVAANPVRTSDNYAWEECLHITVNYLENDLFGSVPGRDITIEDYFLDNKHNRMALSIGQVFVGNKFVLPPNTPSVIWKDVAGKLWLYSGEGYDLPVPAYDTPPGYDEVAHTRRATGKLLKLLVGLSEATRDQ